MLAVKSLEVYYGDFRAVAEINLKLRPGILAALIGPNGSGKSTLLKAIAGVLDYSGSVMIDGAEVRELGPWERVKYVTYVPAAIASGADVTVGDLLLSSEGIDLKLLEVHVNMFDLGGLLGRKLWEVSTGELGRALIARGLSRLSKVYLLDEPLSHIDLRYQIRALKYLRELVRKGRLVIIASNQLSPLLSFADHVIVIKSGRILKSGATKEVVNSALIEELYGVKAEVVRYGNLIDVVPVDEVETKLISR